MSRLEKLKPLEKGVRLENSVIVAKPLSREVFILDDLASLVWESLYAGINQQEVAELIANHFKRDITEVRDEMNNLLGQWQQNNLLVSNNQYLFFKLADYNFSVELNCSEILSYLDSVFSHLYTDRVEIIDYEFLVEKDLNCRFQLFRNDALIFESDSIEAIVQRLIYEIIEASYRTIDFLAVLHSAAIKWRGLTMLLPGKGGSGKSTLSAAMMYKGAKYLADDVVPLLDQQGTILPINSGICLKENSWSLVERLFPKLEKYPYIQRDNKSVKYLPAQEKIVSPRHVIDTLIFPAFNPDAKNQINKLTAVETFEKLYTTATWFDGHANPHSISALTAIAKTKPAYILEFSELNAALELIETVSD